MDIRRLHLVLLRVEGFDWRGVGEMAGFRTLERQDNEGASCAP